MSDDGREQVRARYAKAAQAVTEMFRVLTPGSRIGIRSLIAQDHLTPTDRAERGSYVGCISGGLSRPNNLDGLAAARFTHSEGTCGRA